ncbi:25116_t:CDS:1, partial [Gigaspora rosea]
SFMAFISPMSVALDRLRYIDFGGLRYVAFGGLRFVSSLGSSGVLTYIIVGFVALELCPKLKIN